MNPIKYIFSLLAFFLIISCKKESIPDKQPTSPDKVYFQDVQYGHNINWLGADENLLMDIYLPDGAVNSANKYPFILYVHGGGFVKGDKTLGATYARKLNQLGFVVASINYRLGWTQDTVNMCNGDTLEAKKAIYRALQDTRAAFRFLSANATQYAIDTSWMFLSGSSAGGVTTLFLPVVNEQNAPIIFPGFAATMGPLNASNTLTNKFTLKGLIDMWGIISDLNLITKQNALPTLIFHGMNDRVAPYGVSHFYSCESFPISYGAKPVYDRLISLNVPVVANIDPTGGHGVYDATFRANNTSCFIRALMQGKPQTGFYTDGSGNCK